MKKLFLIAFIACIAGKSIGQNTASFEKFWSAFQPLLVAKNYNMLAKHVQFPLSVKGVLDDVPVLKITKTKFAGEFAKYLSIEDMNWNDTKINTYKKWKKLPASEKQNIQDGTARIDDMQFTYKNGKWLLTLYYDGRTE